MSERLFGSLGRVLIGGGIFASSISACSRSERIVIDVPASTPTPDRGCSTYIVEPGDSLWRISENYLGNGARYGEIIDENDERVPTIAKVIEPGMQLKVCQIPGEGERGQVEIVPAADTPTQEPIQPQPQTQLSEGLTEMGDGTVEVDLPELPKLTTTEDFTEAFTYNLEHRTQMTEEAKENVRRSTVFLQIEAPGKVFTCSGIHLDNGKIATAHHCFADFPANELVVNVRSADGDWYEGGSIRSLQGVDAAVLSIADYNEDSFVSIKPTSKIRVGEEMFMDSVKERGENQLLEREYQGVYLGQTDDSIVDPAKLTLDYSFYIMVGEEVLETGFSGSGVTNKDGELTGILIGSGAIEIAGRQVSVAYAVRSEFIEYLAR